jgi:hypothetical protein
MSAEWVTRFGYLVASKPSRPGIYRLKSGGFLVRGRVTDPKNGKRRAVIKALHGVVIEEAQRVLDELKADRAAELRGRKPQRQRFDAFASSRFEAKVLAGDIRSAKGRDKWESILRVHLFPEFGAILCEELTPWDFAQWRTKLARMIAEGYESSRRLRNGQIHTRRVMLRPETANTWIRVVRTLGAEMAKLLRIEDPTGALEPFDTSQHPTYTDEAPNSLTTAQAREFLDEMRRRFPQHYAMTFIGFITGKRPSTLRPLRRRGAECDVDWEDGYLSFRRSNTKGDEFMVGTKTGTQERVHVPESALQILREHIALLESPPKSRWGKAPLWWRTEMAESELLFPGRDGGPRSPSCLDKAFEEVSRAIGLRHPVTPRAMRRTCNDLQRDAKIADAVTMSITGHVTDKMRIRYSTAQAQEQRQAIATVIDLVTAARKAG